MVKILKQVFNQETSGMVCGANILQNYLRQNRPKIIHSIVAFTDNNYYLLNIKMCINVV